MYGQALQTIEAIAATLQMPRRAAPVQPQSRRSIRHWGTALPWCLPLLWSAPYPDALRIWSVRCRGVIEVTRGAVPY